MKKNSITLFIFLLLGLLTAAIFTQLFSEVSWLSFMTRSAQIKWEPSADFNVVSYDISLHIKLNLFSVLGIAAAIWIYRKL
ncbi:DUF4321 domain-containing protein [Paenibacillus koleovorans]|uniref:DUF4321 domain-containing protein n=1 Tax=Paenibacillus koleovorans TaxID=121608 RepID=UPI000FD9D0A2|nr:DUF4321 domain-containing protein [Paenibacillus koleovorans]